MSLETLIPFLAIIAIATYVQSVAGFALGMIVMGAVTTLNLMPIAFTSVIISAVTLINSFFVIKTELKVLNPRIVGMTALGLVPGLLIGLYLLQFLSASFNQILQNILGVVIILAGISMVLKAKAKTQKESHSLAFLACGTASGLFTGLFSIGGPPLVFIFYRQPLPLTTIRSYLLSIFLISSIGRIGMVAVQGDLTAQMGLYVLACMPIVILVSALAKRYPPPITMDTMRKVAFCLLVIIGVSLLIN